MLDGMRKMSQHWFGRILMGFVLLFISGSFVIWGVGDIFTRVGTQKVAEVGSTYIPTESYRNQYQTQLLQLQREARRAITNDQARALGLDRQVLNNMIGQTLLDEVASGLHLALSEQDIARAVMADPNFAGPNGRFDPLRFQEILRDNGFNEASFAREQRKGYVRQSLVEVVAGKMPMPNATLDAVHRYRSETREVEYFEIPASIAGDVGTPDDKALSEVFEARRATFRAPEYRKFTYLSLSPASVADPSKVSDADLRALYDRVKGQRYGTPERRRVEQMSFSDEKAAADALARIRAGEKFEDVAKAVGVSVVDVGTVTRGELIDQTLANAAFSLAQGAVSDPVKTQFGTMLVTVPTVEPEKVKPLAEVSDELRREIAVERARSTIRNLRDKVEDERSSGKALADAAKVVDVSPLTVEVDSTGTDTQGKAAELPEREALLRAVFASDVGVDNDHVTTRDGAFIWFEVLNVEQSRERRLDEVRDQVVATWKEEEINKRMAAKVSEILTGIRGGQSMADAAKSNKAELKREASVSRLEPSKLPESAVARVFGQPVGEVGSATTPDLGRVIFKSLSNNIPAMEAQSDVMKQISDQLRSAMSEDLLTQYLSALRGQLGVTIYEAAVRSATGATDQNN